MDTATDGRIAFLRFRSFAAFLAAAAIAPELVKRRNPILLLRYSTAIFGVMAKPYSSTGAFTHHRLMPGFLGRNCCAASVAAWRRWFKATVASWAMLNRPSSVAVSDCLTVRAAGLMISPFVVCVQKI